MSNIALQKILVVSPFFDRGDAWIADELAKAMGVPAELHIVTDEANILKLGRCHCGLEANGQARKVSLIPAPVSTDELERITR
jgi:hypothetical protein